MAASPIASSPPLERAAAGPALVGPDAEDEARADEMQAEVAEVQMRLELAAVADTPLTDDEREDVTQICSATGVDESTATAALRSAKGDVNIAVVNLYAHKNRVEKGWVRDDAVLRTISEGQGKIVMWVDLIGGEGIRYTLDDSERANALNHWYQVVIDGPFGQTWTSSAVRRALSPMWKEQVPFVLPTSSVVYLRVTVVALSGDVIATGDAKLPVKRSGTIACSCALVGARPGANESSCGHMLVTASQTRVGPTSITKFTGARRQPRDDIEFDADLIFGDDEIAERIAPNAPVQRAAMRTISEPARATQVDNPLLGPDLDAVQDDFDVQRTKTSDRVRMSAAKYTLADDSHGSEDLLLRLLRRRLASKMRRFEEPRVDTKSSWATPALCSVCKKAPALSNRGTELLRSCGHMVCSACLIKHVQSAIKSNKVSNVMCPTKFCREHLTPSELKRILPPSVYEEYETGCLEEYLNSNTIGRCPTCQATFVLEKNTNTQATVAAEGIDKVRKDKEGKPIMERKALTHYNKYRFRCPECSTSFCTSCKVAPFHAGYGNCDAYALAVSGRQCRWCETVLTEDNIWQNHMCKGTLKNTCCEEECTNKARIACLKSHECGHECGGVRNEKDDAHLPCLRCGEEPDVAHDDFCPICWTEGLSLAPSIKLACGHIVHAQCVEKQLKERWGDKPRIQFGFMACPACRQDIAHPYLEADHLEPLRRLKGKIESLAEEQMVEEYPLMEPEEQAKADAAGHVDYAMAHFSFELCHQCQFPYFAGRVDCAAGLDDAGPEAQARAEDGVCRRCRDKTGMNTAVCKKHGKDALKWKCRYGCHISTYECFGYLHVCDPCHSSSELSRNMDFNVRVEGGHPRRGGVPGTDRVYANKKDIWEYEQCPGKDKCPLGIDHPPTGVEYCIGCVFCDDEAEMDKQLEAHVVIFQQLADVAKAGHGDGFVEGDYADMKPRLLHAMWLVGERSIADSVISKRQAIQAMQLLMRHCELAFDKYPIKLKGSVDALRKSRSPSDLATLVAHWRVDPEVLDKVMATSVIAVSVSQPPTETEAPTAVAVSLSVGYVDVDAQAKIADDMVAGSATASDVMAKLAELSKVNATDAQSVVLHFKGEPLSNDARILPLFSSCASSTLQLEATTEGGWKSYMYCTIA
eukprot:m.63056 g.63056  ORF g.63056 m.63056 type:complete len:1152 (-) comp8130_c0_seq1:38-3493(-)